MDDETLALDDIKMIVPGGTCAAEKHTGAHMKDVWRTRVWDCAPYQTGLRDGGRGALQNAEVRAREILATHAPAPLPEDVRAELRRLVEVAEGELR